MSYPQVLVLSRSTGICGRGAVEGACERVGVLRCGSAEKTSSYSWRVVAEVLMNWFADAKVEVVHLV